MHPVIPYVLAAALFAVGFYGVLVRRNVVLLLASIELMLGAVNLIFVTADVAPLMGGAGHSGQSFALFVIVLAAAEIGVGLALVLHLYRLRGDIDADAIDTGDGTVDGGDARGLVEARDTGCVVGSRTDGVG